METMVATPLASDIDIARRILGHIEAHTTDEGESWREPVAHYVDPKRFDEELQTLQRSASVFLPSAAIANPGDYRERVAFGVPLVAVRDRSGRARVFRNACRHRGVSLVEGSGCARALVCPYHGWTYRLDGALAHVPHTEGFPDLEMSERGLVEVASREVDGLIVIDAVDGDVGSGSLASFDADAQALTDGAVWRDKLLPASRLLSVSHRVQAINWKVLVEQFIEGLHIRTTHRETFYPLQYDNLNVIETFGPNSRVTYPYRNIERLRDRPEATWNIDARVTFVYHLFPNVMVATFPDQVIVIVIDPIDVGQSAVTTYNLAKPALADDRSAARTDADTTAESAGRSLVDRGGLEDNAMSLAVQRGLHAGANEYLEFGRHESAIGHFHRTLDDRLARRP